MVANGMGNIFFHDIVAPNWLGPRHRREFIITLRHTTLVRTALDERSERRSNFYLTIHNIKKTDIYYPCGIRTRISVK
jgi:hypothetical protein